MHRLGAVLLQAILRIRAVRPDRWRRAIFCWPGAGPTRAAVRAGRCAPNTTTSPTRLSPPPPCAGRRSGRPGAAAPRPGAISPSHRLGAVLLRAVLRIRAERPDHRRRAIFRWPSAGPTRAAVRAGRCALNTTTSPTRLSPPPPCAGRRSGRPGAAASRPGAVLHFHQLGAVLLRAGRRPGRAVRPDAGRRPGGEVRLEYDLVVAVSPAVGCLQTGRCGALTRILVGAAVVAGPGRLHCHLRRRAPAAGAAGPAPPLR